MAIKIIPENTSVPLGDEQSTILIFRMRKNENSVIVAEEAG